MSTKPKVMIGGAVVVAGILLYLLMQTPATPPKEFLEARIQTIGAVNNLAQLMNNSLSNLEKVSGYIEKNNDIEAKALIDFEFAQRKERQNAAVLLASNLEQMARSATAIKSGGARSEAVEAITSGISMVSRMVSYSNNLERLFGELQQKANGANPATLNLNTLSTNLNNDAKAINELSEEFNDALRQLDKRYGIK